VPDPPLGPAALQLSLIQRRHVLSTQMEPVARLHTTYIARRMNGRAQAVHRVFTVADNARETHN